MQVMFESRDPEGQPLRDDAVRRVQFVMRRLKWLLSRARVCLSDDNGPRGGVDKRCRVELSMRHGGTVQITAVARDWRSAIDSALSRAARVLMRQLRRSQRIGREPAPA
jgi:ribosome-associated translation inhibitor RaiA